MTFTESEKVVGIGFTVVGRLLLLLGMRSGWMGPLCPG